MKKNKLIDKFNTIENNSKDLSHDDIIKIIEIYIINIQLKQIILKILSCLTKILCMTLLLKQTYKNI